MVEEAVTLLRWHGLAEQGPGFGAHVPGTATDLSEA